MDFLCNHPAVALGYFVRNDAHRPSDETVKLISTLIAVNTMDTTTVKFEGVGGL
jgi:hypothetical protein